MRFFPLSSPLFDQLVSLMPFFIQYSTAVLLRQGIVEREKGRDRHAVPPFFFDTKVTQNQFPSASQPQVEPFPLKGLCSNRGSNRDSSQGQDSCSSLPREDSDLARDLPVSSQPQPFLPSFPLRPRPSFPLQPQPSFPLRPQPSFPLQPQPPFPLRPKMPFPFCPQKSSKSMIQQEFIGVHLLFLSYHIVCEKKEMVLTSRHVQESFF